MDELFVKTIICMLCYRTNVTKILHDTLDSVPFALSNPANGYQIMVTEAIEAENILKELDVTHSNFIPYTVSSLHDEDWVFGEVIMLGCVIL